MLIGAPWQTRALLRAQLIEEGWEVLATDAWRTARQWLLSGLEPWLVVVDLQQLADPKMVLRELHTLFTPDRVLVLSGVGTVPSAELHRFGFEVVSRPIAIEAVVAAASRLVEKARAKES
jgi:DNA-binding NtrC family response regulator